MSINITTTHTLTDDFLQSVLITAAEGGINYWAHITDYVWDAPASEQRIHAVDSEDDDETYTITHDTIAKGVEGILNGNPGTPAWCQGRILADLQSVDGNIDATAADCIVQTGLFGRIIFG